MARRVPPVALAGAGRPRLPRSAIAPGWHDEAGFAQGGGLVDPAGVVGAVAAEHRDPLGFRHLRQQTRHDPAVAVPAVGHPDGPHLVAVRVDDRVDLAPDPALAGPVLPDLPLALARHLFRPVPSMTRCSGPPRGR